MHDACLLVVYWRGCNSGWFGWFIVSECWQVLLSCVLSGRVVCAMQSVCVGLLLTIRMHFNSVHWFVYSHLPGQSELALQICNLQDALQLDGESWTRFCLSVIKHNCEVLCRNSWQLVVIFVYLLYISYFLWRVCLYLASVSYNYYYCYIISCFILFCAQIECHLLQFIKTVTQCVYMKTCFIRPCHFGM